MVRLSESRPGVDEPADDQIDDLEEFEADFDEDELEERIADYDPGELAYSYRLRPPPRHQKHSPLIILASVLGVVLGLAIWVGVLTAVAGNVSGYLGDSVQNLAPHQSHVTVTSVAACGSSPCDTTPGAHIRNHSQSPDCAAVSGTSAVLSRAGVWFVTGCSGG